MAISIEGSPSEPTYRPLKPSKNSLLTEDQLIRFAGLIVKMTKKTKQGKIDWESHVESSGRDFSYTWNGPKFKINLTVIRVRDSNAHRLNIQNEDGRSIGDFWGSQGDKVDNKCIVDLAQLLFNKYGKTLLKEKHQAIDDIMTELDSLEDNAILGLDDDIKEESEKVGEKIEYPSSTTIKFPTTKPKKKSFFKRLFTGKKKQNER